MSRIYMMVEVSIFTLVIVMSKMIIMKLRISWLESILRGQALPVKWVLMINLSSWNIRGLNRVPKQNEVKDVVLANKLSICAIAESHVLRNRLSSICDVVFPRWHWTSNSRFFQGGTRVIVGWDPDVVDIMVVALTDQVVHCLVKSLMDGKQLFVSFVYGYNYYIQRRALWRDLCMHKGFVGNHSWVVMGDFNASLWMEESTSGASSMTISMREFQDCVDELSGCGFEWMERGGLWMSYVPSAEKVTWSREASSLDAAQQLLDANPNCQDLREAVGNALRDFNAAVLEEELFLKQKAKIEWLHVGDFNSQYFHSVVKGRTHRAHIHSIVNEDGTVIEGSDVPKRFVEHYELFLGSAHHVQPIEHPDMLFTKKVSDQNVISMSRQVTEAEVKEAMFDIGIDKSPGPDGFNSEFYKVAWDIVSEDVTKAVF
ncbi:uncharacterized protein [Rutidosis leptorrhynchoides]|uniref:uncharacterized protein n=1 Tax=Rutidosis leptorrhynchoides TaxID=125765 RepID=UPI003A997ACD